MIGMVFYLISYFVAEEEDKDMPKLEDVGEDDEEEDGKEKDKKKKKKIKVRISIKKIAHIKF